MPDTRRRVFIQHGALALVALGLPPAFLSRSVVAGTPGGRRKVMVCIFQRGAVDGLNMVVPFGEHAYYASRGSIAVPPPGRGTDGAIDLDGFFGLHPTLSPLHEVWQRGEMAIVHAVGSPQLRSAGTIGSMKPLSPPLRARARLTEPALCDVRARSTARMSAPRNSPPEQRG